MDDRAYDEPDSMNHSVGTVANLAQDFSRLDFGFETKSRPVGSRADVQLQNGLPLVLVDGHIPAIKEHSTLVRQMALKRAFLDLPLSALAILALLPLLLLISVGIKVTSKGPVFFRQKREGLAGKEFEILKFRTMYWEWSDANGTRQTVRNDARVTPLGRILRASSIDELPQLFNILMGDMSVIGPRPMVRAQLAGDLKYRDAVTYYDQRHLVRPGLSGWAQVNGFRGPTTDPILAKKRIDFDCAYVQNVSLSLDVKIIWQTVCREFLTGTGL